MSSKSAQKSVIAESIAVSEIDTGTHPEYMNHEAVYRILCPEHTVTAFVAIHNTALGPGLGGIRYKHYETEDDALADVLRLSEAMTWKNAAAGLDFGGGKTVLTAPAGSRIPDKTALEVLAHGLNIINSNGPLYYGAEDMNISEECLDHILLFSPWIKGGSVTDPRIVAGTPSPLTAIGVFECMKIAAAHKLRKESLRGVKVALQGLGAVGMALAKLLHGEGAILTGTDPSDKPFETLQSEGITIEQAGLDEVYDVPVDIFAPNAVGGTLTEETVGRLHRAGVKIVCGAANNQQKDQTGFTESKLMQRLGMLYCPDYIVNAGGVIWVAKVGEEARQVTENIRTGVPRRFQEVLDLHAQNPGADMATIASQYSRLRVRAAGQKRKS